MVPVRIVLDLNILVSAIISKQGPPGQLLTLWRERQYTLVTSSLMLDRLQQVLARPQLRRFIEESEAIELIKGIQDSAILVECDHSDQLTSDPEDDIVLATAIAGQVDLLVTGDQQHLLPMGSIEGIPIVTARQAIERIRLNTSS